MLVVARRTAAAAGLGAVAPAAQLAASTAQGGHGAGARPTAPGRARRAGHLAQTLDGALAGPWPQQLNALLKRLCRERYPGERQPHPEQPCSAGVSRQPLPWQPAWTRWMILVDGSYKPQCTLSDKAIAGTRPGHRHLDLQTCLSSLWPWVLHVGAAAPGCVCCYRLPTVAACAAR